MGEESLRIIARHGIGETLATFEELYELVTRPDHVPAKNAADLQTLSTA